MSVKINSGEPNPATGNESTSITEMDVAARYLEALKNVTRIKLNLRREVLFAIPQDWVDNYSGVYLSLTRLNPTAEFGKNGVARLKDMPTRALASIYRALRQGSLIDASHETAQQAAKIPDHAPKRAVKRVEGGKDPVLASGYDVEDLEKVLTPPSSANSDDPEGDVIRRIHTSSAGKDYKGLVALEHMESCSRRRSRILIELENMIQSHKNKPVNSD